MKNLTTYIANSETMQLQIIGNELLVIHKNSKTQNTHVFDPVTMWNYINNLGFTKQDFTKLPF